MQTRPPTLRGPHGPRPREPKIFQDTPPLTIKKINQPPLSDSLSSRPSGLKLTIGTPSGRPTTPKPPKLSIPLPSSDYDGYYGGGPAPVASSGGSEGEVTILPRATTNPDAITVHPKRDEPMENLRNVISKMPSMHIADDAADDSVVHDALFSDPWSDDVLEEVSRLGEGAGGAVHKVKDKRTGKILARKTITTREAPMKQLERELSIMSSTQHINIIHFHGAYMSPSSSEVKILMDYCEGGSLESIGKQIKERNAIVGEKIAGRLAEGVLQGLAYLHTKQTIHRDIKPSNILLTKEGIVKLCDFGVSGKLEGSMAYTFTGTSFYMAPERICGHTYSIRSDVWSTGISLLELVQNRFPFPNDLPPIELMMYITTGEPPRLEDDAEVVWSSDMKDFIKQTLTVDPANRPTPKDMLSHPWIVEKHEVGSSHDKVAAPGLALEKNNPVKGRLKPVSAWNSQWSLEALFVGLVSKGRGYLIMPLLLRRFSLLPPLLTISMSWRDLMRFSTRFFICLL
ncbi:kinase-like domain-containing protein [Rhodocollybia butyracea]|uniref:mitogen-activated protein kinase kinase n=1 Tax=Rhodocollybia butyracea TaxID=206335 RepID=A0A9P5U8L1_9AGAR|nr:kinase-like domain-containing protein [Rhodocollybia butyracea]